MTQPNNDDHAMPPGSVIITPTQMYGEIRLMAGKVDHLASILDPALATIREDLITMAAQNRASNTDFESRLRSLDKRIWIIFVGAAASGAGISQLLPLIGGN